MTEHQFPLRQQFHKLLVEALQPIWEGDLPGKVLVKSGARAPANIFPHVNTSLCSIYRAPSRGIPPTFLCYLLGQDPFLLVRMELIGLCQNLLDRLKGGPTLRRVPLHGPDGGKEE